MKTITNKFVVCIDNDSYPSSLELHKIYRVLPDADAAVDGDLRVIDESGEDYLYPSAYFVPIQVPQTVEKSLLRTS
jgi:hypothetical protein